MNKPTINGIDVSECEYINCCSKKAKCIILQDDILSDSQYCESEPDCYFKQLKRLQEENEKIKKQYNCYACGNCNGKEDYIHLEKHHKGLRKQFDELAKRNNTLSLRIEELEKENEKLKEKNKELLNLCNNGGALLFAESTKNKKYKQALEEIRKLINKTCWDYTDISIIPVKEKMLDKINEVLNDRN